MLLPLGFIYVILLKLLTTFIAFYAIKKSLKTFDDYLAVIPWALISTAIYCLIFFEMGVVVFFSTVSHPTYSALHFALYCALVTLATSLLDYLIIRKLSGHSTPKLLGLTLLINFLPVATMIARSYMFQVPLV